MIQFETELFKDTSLRTQVIRWAPLGYQFSSGIFVNAFGEGMQAERLNFMKAQLTQVGAEMGWGSSPPNRGQSGGAFRVGLSVSQTELKTEFSGSGIGVPMDEYNDPTYKGPLIIGRNGGAIVSQGIGTGAVATYSYAINDGFGIELTGAAAQARFLKHSTQGEINCGGYEYYSGRYIYNEGSRCEMDWRGRVRMTSLTGGITYRF